MRLIVRTATPADFSALGALFIQGDAWHAAHIPTVFCVPDDPPRSHDYLQNLLDDIDSTLLVTERDNELLGVLTLLLRPAPDLPMMRPRRIGIVDSLIVAERARRQGIGRRLLLAGEEWFRAQNCQDLQLTVWECNVGARALYAQLGYQPQSRRLAKRLKDSPADASS